MNIQTAAHYAQHGYRIRRSSWQPGALIGKMDNWFYHIAFVTGSEGMLLPISASWTPNCNDLMADDWELILEGIDSDFGVVKYKEKSK